MSDAPPSGMPREPDLIEQIEELQVLLEEAKAVPLSASAVVNREEVLDLLAALKESVPDEVRRARWMLRDHQELLDRARRKAEDLIAEAERRGERAVSEATVVAAAERRARDMIEEAEQHAARIRREAQAYVDGKLADFEELLDKTKNTVARGRERLRESPGSERAGSREGSVVFDADRSSQELST